MRKILLVSTALPLLAAATLNLVFEPQLSSTTNADVAPVQLQQQPDSPHTLRSEFVLSGVGSEMLLPSELVLSKSNHFSNNS